MTWEIVIGLEVHAQLNTKSKIFSGSSTAYGAPPNTQANIVDLGMPGVLPVLNAEAVRKAAKFGLAIGANVAKRSVFDRKNYFYPDLPKGYQISQFQLPIVENGTLKIHINGAEKVIGITRAHLEEDAGKSLHEDFHGQTGIDLNRAGTPLLEIVSEPDLRSSAEAVAYLKKLHALVTYLDICDGNMQEGSFRCDANVSVRKPGEPFGTRCEIKNVNSFKFVEKAIEFEVERQIELIESGGKVVQQTRLYDPDKDETRPMREKEEANDYRYFPCPDLLPVELTEEYIEDVRKSLPELPEAKFERFMSEYGLSEYDAQVLTSSRALADYFETATSKSKAKPKTVANWVSVELLGLLNKNSMNLAQSPISAETLAQLTTRIEDGTISGKIAKSIFEDLWAGETNVDLIIDAKGLKQVSDPTAIMAIVDKIIDANPDNVAAYKSGKDKLFGFFVGQVMKETGGKANPGEVNKILKEKLS